MAVESTAVVPTPAPARGAPSLFATVLDRSFWVALVLGGIYFWYYLHGGQVGPEPVVDPAFVKLGKAFKGHLADAYADSWTVAATDLEGGKSMNDASQTFAKAWTDNGAKALADNLTPALAKIVPEGQKTLSDAERTAMVRAWRGLAKGLKQ